MVERFEKALVEAGWARTTAKDYARGARVFVFWLATGTIPAKWEAGAQDPARVSA